MRSVSATLKAAQSSDERTPHIHMVFTSYDGNTTYNLSTDGDYGNRILLIDHREEAYNDWATVTLNNYDRALPEDLTGYWTEIGYGDTTGAGNESAATPRLWVKRQQDFSMAGKLLMILELEGMWAKLGETLMRLGDPPLYRADWNTGSAYEIDTGSCYDIINYILTNSVDPAMSLDALAEDDGILDTLEPSFVINASQPFEDAKQIISVLLRMSMSFLRPKSSLAWEVKYPQEDDAIDLSYYSYGTPYFYEYVELNNLVIPNRIYVFANAGDDGRWTDVITAQADETDSQGRYGVVPDVDLAPRIDNQTDADNRALAILHRSRYEASSFSGQTVLTGRLVIQHDCQMELYDRVGIYDDRGL